MSVKPVPVLKARGISKTFVIPSSRRATVREHIFGVFQARASQRLRILQDVSFEVARGEALGIMGRNGSGKSTLLKIVSGIYPPDRGSVVRNAPITPILELGVGWNPELDAIDNILLIGSVMGMTLSEIHSAIDGILDFAELTDFAHLQLKFYSTGMAARLAYSIAFHAVREVLILDEIFAVGDAGFKQRCRQRYGELRDAGHTILLVSHEPSVIAESCDRALLLDEGRIREEGPADQVVESYLSLLG